MSTTYIRNSVVIRSGTAARSIKMNRNVTAATEGQGLTLDAGGATTAATNKAGGNLILKGGVATGSGSSAVELWGATAGGSGTADSLAALLATVDAAGLLFKGEAARLVGMARNLTAATAGQGLTVDAGGAVLLGTNKAGGDLTLKSGISTGNTNSAILLQTPAAGGSGTGSNAVATRMTVDENGFTLVGNAKASGIAARTVGMNRNTTAATAGQGFTVDAGGATSGTTDMAGGDLTLKSGISTGSGASAILLQTPAAGGGGTADRTPATRLTVDETGLAVVGNAKATGVAARTFGMNRNVTAATAGQGLTLDAGGAVSGGTDLAGGNLDLKSGIATGNGSGLVRIYAVAGSQGAGTADRSPVLAATFTGTNTLLAGELKVAGTTLGFYNVTPVVQAAITAAGTDAGTTQTLANALRTIAINLGLMAAA